MNDLKVQKNGIKFKGEYIPCWYSIGNYTKESKIEQNTITVYSKTYKHLPNIEELNTINNSDIMTDYFEKDKWRVTINSPYYPLFKKFVK